MRIKPDETLFVRLENALQTVSKPHEDHSNHNKVSAAPKTNLHFHGLWVSGETTTDNEGYLGDDVYVVSNPTFGTIMIIFCDSFQFSVLNICTR